MMSNPRAVLCLLASLAVSLPSAAQELARKAAGDAVVTERGAHHSNVPTALHRRMEAAGLGPGYMAGYDDPVELMRDMLDFYDLHYPECGTALRAWANKHGVPY